MGPEQHTVHSDPQRNAVRCAKRSSIKQHFPLSNIRAESDVSESARIRPIRIAVDPQPNLNLAIDHPAWQGEDDTTEILDVSPPES